MSLWPAWLRRLVNPVSTQLTRMWNGVGSRRQVPARPAPIRIELAERRPGLTTRSFTSVLSPGDWVVPDGFRPGWEWLPEHGAVPNLRGVPRWVRLWYATPWLDRFAYQWMWWHGGWSVRIPGDPPEPPPDAGDRAPLRPPPTPTRPAGADGNRGRAR